MLSESVFIEGIAKLSRVFPESAPSEQAVEIYRDRLARLTNEQFVVAVNHHLDFGKWFPKISELLAIVPEDEPTPIDVLQRLISAAERGIEPAMDAPTRAALAVYGGWERFQFTLEHEIAFRFKYFKEALLSAREKKKKCEALIGVVRDHLKELPEPEG